MVQKSASRGVKLKSQDRGMMVPMIMLLEVMLWPKDVGLMEQRGRDRDCDCSSLDM